jgi:hypothetical protein
MAISICLHKQVVLNEKKGKTNQKTNKQTNKTKSKSLTRLYNTSVPHHCEKGPEKRRNLQIKERARS